MYILPGVAGRVVEKQRDVYIHFTVATDTKNVKLVFEDVRSLIIEINLREGLM